MKILYGVQATGQGHLSRAYAMASSLQEYAVDVTWLISGRDKDKLFDMELLGDFEHRSGLSFATDKGRLRYRRTLKNNSLAQFMRDVRDIDLSRFDLVITDFEPITAWAAKLSGAPSIGIGHQYAFGNGTPKRGLNPISNTIMRGFAPVQTGIGLHWYPYDNNILPPIVHLPDVQPANEGHIVVYLPFEDQAAVTAMLQQLPEFCFVQFASTLEDKESGNVLLRKAGTQRFKHQLANAAGVICNCGFELISECMQWGKPVLTKPLSGQPEQLSNAYALELLSCATVIKQLSSTRIHQWLQSPQAHQSAAYPDVAHTLSRWIASGCAEAPAQLSHRLWSSTGKSETERPRMPLVAARALTT